MSGKRGDDFDVRLLDGRRETYSYHVKPEEGGVRLDRFLTGRLAWRSRTSVQRLLDEGQVALEGRGARASRKVLVGDVVTVTLPRTVRDECLAESRDLDLDLRRLFEDEALIAIDKPPDVAVHPSGQLLHNTVITALHRAYRDFEDPERDVVPKLCHRLDLETSGVLLVAKTHQTLVGIQQQFEKRTVHKEYLALVHGRIEDEEGLIDLPIGPNFAGKVRNSRTIRHDVGQPSRTRWRVVDRWRDYTLCWVELLTGRHHQIRVHMSALGHPVVGDKVYGRDETIFLRFSDRTITEDDWRVLELRRQALHSHAITFRHPTGGMTRIASPWPTDLKAFCRDLPRA